MPAVLPTLPAYCFLVFFAFYNVLPSVGSQGGLRTPNHPVTFGSCGVAPLYLLIPQPSALPIEIPRNNLSISISLLSISLLSSNTAIITELRSQSTCNTVPSRGSAPLSHSLMTTGGSIDQLGLKIGATTGYCPLLAGSTAPRPHLLTLAAIVVG